MRAVRPGRAARGSRARAAARCGSSTRSRRLRPARPPPRGRCPGSSATVASLTGAGGATSFGLAERGPPRIGVDTRARRRSPGAAESGGPARVGSGSVHSTSASSSGPAARSASSASLPDGAIVLTAPTPFRSTGAMRTTQWPPTAPAQASITLSERRRTRLGDAAGAVRPSGVAKRSSSSGRAEAHAGGRAVDVHRRLAAALLGSRRRSRGRSSLSSAAIRVRSRPARAAGRVRGARWRAGRGRRSRRPAPTRQRVAAVVQRERERLHRAGCRRRRRALRTKPCAKKRSTWTRSPSAPSPPAGGEASATSPR